MLADIWCDILVGWILKLRFDSYYKILNDFLFGCLSVCPAALIVFTWIPASIASCLCASPCLLVAETDQHYYQPNYGCTCCQSHACFYWMNFSIFIKIRCSNPDMTCSSGLSPINSGFNCCILKLVKLCSIWSSQFESTSCEWIFTLRLP